MNIYDYILISAYFLNLAIPMFLSLCCFIFRIDDCLFSKWMAFKWGGLWNCSDGFDKLIFFIVTEIVLVGLLAFLLLSLSKSFGEIAYLYTLFAVCLVFAPLVLRYIVDLLRNLKIKPKTGDSETIADLQKQIDELKLK